MIKVVKFPDLMLKQMCDPVKNFEEVEEMLLNMKKFVEAPENGAAGLALPQVGFALRGFVANVGGQVKIFINPRIDKHGIVKERKMESCLSIINKYVSISRYGEVTVSYVNLKGNKIENVKLKGEAARVFQHELDHLDGVLITDYEQHKIAN